MKMIKIALLGTAALAAVSVSARADSLSDLKAQIEALNARVASIETAPAVPAGYSLMTISDAATITAPGETLDPMYFGPTASTIGIMPTADAPAAVNIQWSGFVRAALVYNASALDATYSAILANETHTSTHDLHIKARGELDVKATNDTAVGEVGVKMAFRSDIDGSILGGVTMPTAWGWWKMTPELAFGGGIDGLGGVGHGTDKLTAMYTDGALSVGGPGDRASFKVSYASGPISMDIAAQHWVTGSSIGGAGQIGYAGDSFSAQVAGWVHDNDWQIGAGATASMDMFTLSASGAYGHQSAHNFNVLKAGIAVPFTQGVGADYWGANVYASAALSDSIKAEIGYGYGLFNTTDPFLSIFNLQETKNAVAGGIYYTPVSQLTMGVEGSWAHVNTSTTAPTNTDTTTIVADFVSVFRF